MNFKLSLYGLNSYFFFFLKVCNSIKSQDLSTSSPSTFLSSVPTFTITGAKLNAAWMTTVTNSCYILCWQHNGSTSALGDIGGSWLWLTDSEIMCVYYGLDISSSTSRRNSIIIIFSLFPYLTGNLRKYLSWPSKLQSCRRFFLYQTISNTRRIT